MLPAVPACSVFTLANRQARTLVRAVCHPGQGARSDQPIGRSSTPLPRATAERIDVIALWQCRWRRRGRCSLCVHHPATRLFSRSSASSWCFVCCAAHCHCGRVRCAVLSKFQKFQPPGPDKGIKIGTCLQTSIAIYHACASISVNNPIPLMQRHCVPDPFAFLTRGGNNLKRAMQSGSAAT